MFKTFTKISSLALAMALTVSPVAFAQTQDIVGVASSTDATSTLVAAVTAADLVETLQGDGPFTVFAPTNDAFAALGSTVDILLKEENKDLLTDILTYHVVSGNVDSATALTLSSADTVQGDAISITNDNGSLVLNGSTNVVTPDVPASNGVIHVIDSVLLSDSLAARVTEAVENDSNAVANGHSTIRTGGFNTLSIIAIAGVIALFSAGLITSFKISENK